MYNKGEKSGGSMENLSIFKGRGLGTFVAPGAIGLLFGKLL